MILKIRLSVIFIHDIRHGGAFGTIDSLSISWNSHPSEVLPEPPSLPDSPTKGCCDWTEVSLSSCVSLPHGKLSRFPSCIFFARSFKVLAYGLRGCRDFIPAAGLTYSECCIFNFQAALKGFLFAPLLIGNWERAFHHPVSKNSSKIFLPLLWISVQCKVEHLEYLQFPAEIFPQKNTSSLFFSALHSRAL